MTTTTEIPRTDQDTTNLFDIGTLVNLKVSTWSGRKTLTRADMVSVGIDPDNLPGDIVNLGGKLLVPKDELRKMTYLEQQARSYLAKWSVPFGISSAHFVPIKMLSDVEEKLISIKKEFVETTDSFIKRFNDMKNKVREEHPEFWEKCLQKHYPPTPEILRAKFKFDWHMFKIAGMNAIQEASLTDIMASEEIKKERVQELRTQMKDEVGGFVEEYVGAMRGETIKFCDLMTARVNERPYGDETEPKKLTGRSLAYFKKYVDRFRKMNIFGDQEIEDLLAQFRDNFLDGNVVPSDLDNGQIKQGITSSLAAIRKKASLEGEEASEFLGQLRRKVVL